MGPGLRMEVFQTQEDFADVESAMPRRIAGTKMGRKYDEHDEIPSGELT